MGVNGEETKLSVQLASLPGAVDMYSALLRSPRSHDLYQDSY